MSEPKVECATPERDLVLARLDAARQALSEAKTLQETKVIADLARAAEVYARRQGMAQEAIESAHAIQVEALRKLGAILRRRPKAQGTRGQLKGTKDGSGATAVIGPEPQRAPSYASVGLDHRTAGIAQGLADLPEAEFEQVRQGDVSVRHAIVAARRRQRDGAFRVPAPVDGQPRRYAVILSDPPWQYEADVPPVRLEGGETLPLPSVLDACSRKLSDFAARDAVLYILSPNAELTRALDLMRSWGFEYRGNVAWVKADAGEGSSRGVHHDLILVGAKGDPPAPSPRASRASVLFARPGKGGEKPEAIYSMIEQAYPDVARAELIARAPRPGWGAVPWNVPLIRRR